MIVAIEFTFNKTNIVPSIDEAKNIMVEKIDFNMKTFDSEEFYLTNVKPGIPTVILQYQIVLL